MPKEKRRFDSENAVEESKKRSKAKRGKGWKAVAATLTICAASFGAYYSPHFRTASSDWLERWRAFLAAKTETTDVLTEESGATADDKMREKLAQAPSFRDFLTDEYGEEGARELLGIDEATSDVSQVDGAVGGFADYVAAETDGSELSENQAFAPSVDAPSLPSSSEPTASFADYVAAKPFGDLGTNGTEVSVEKTRLASSLVPGATDVLSESETDLTARLENEMKERGVGNPRVERWGGRFWRASGFATTNEGVATFCEAVDGDPTAAQRAALTKFEAARF